MSKRWDPAVITAEAEDFSLDACWPEVSRRLQGFLSSQGVDHHTREDIAQEVAARALSREVPFTDVDQLTRWSCTVAKNLAIDHLRSHRRTSALEVVPERGSGADTEAIVEQRRRLRVVLGGVAALSPIDRDAIESAVAGAEAGSRRESVKMAVRRHRARIRLLHLVEGALGILGWVFGLRRVLRASVVAPATVVTAIVVSFVLLVPPPTTPAPADSGPTATFGSIDGVAGARPAAEVHAVAPAPPVRPASAPPRAPAAPPSTPPAHAAPAPPLHAEIHAATPVRPVSEEVRPKREGDHVACLDLAQTLPQGAPICVG